MFQIKTLVWFILYEFEKVNSNKLNEKLNFIARWHWIEITFASAHIFVTALKGRYDGNRTYHENCHDKSSNIRIIATNFIANLGNQNHILESLFLKKPLIIFCRFDWSDSSRFRARFQHFKGLSSYDLNDVLWFSYFDRGLRWNTIVCQITWRPWMTMQKSIVICHIWKIVWNTFLSENYRPNQLFELFLSKRWWDS